jgi:hypothetical protein
MKVLIDSSKIYLTHDANLKLRCEPRRQLGSFATTNKQKGVNYTTRVGRLTTSSASRDLGH